MTEPMQSKSDPAEVAFNAVYAYIQELGDHLPTDTAHRNATIWRAVHAALDATPAGISSHHVEDDHILIVTRTRTWIVRTADEDNSQTADGLVYVPAPDSTHPGLDFASMYSTDARRVAMALLAAADRADRATEEPTR